MTTEEQTNDTPQTTGSSKINIEGVEYTYTINKDEKENEIIIQLSEAKPDKYNTFIPSCINPNKETISLESFKKICNELDGELSEQEIKDILVASTKNGKELTFEEFVIYMQSLG